MGEGKEASWMKKGIRMQIMAWHRKPVDADKEKHPNNMNVNEIILVKLHSSEERCCIYNHFCKNSSSYSDDYLYSFLLESFTLVTSSPRFELMSCFFYGMFSTTCAYARVWFHI